MSDDVIEVTVVQADLPQVEDWLDQIAQEDFGTDAQGLRERVKRVQHAVFVKFADDSDAMNRQLEAIESDEMVRQVGLAEAYALFGAAGMLRVGGIPSDLAIAYAENVVKVIASDIIRLHTQR